MSGRRRKEQSQMKVRGREGEGCLNNYEDKSFLGDCVGDVRSSRAEGAERAEGKMIISAIKIRNEEPLE
jgi:hypothetical protein